MLKLCANGRPSVSGPSNVYCIIDETEFLVGSFKFKIVPVASGIISDESDEIRRAIRDFDGVCFDMSNSESSLHNLVFEVDHEQGPTLSDNIVYVSGVFEDVWESGGGKTINGVDDDLKSVRQRVSPLDIIPFMRSSNEWFELTIEHIAHFSEFPPTNRNACFFERREVLCIRTK